MLKRPEKNGPLLEGSDEYVWAKYLAGTFTIKAGIRVQLESRLRRKYRFTTKQFSEFGFELIRRAGLGTNPPELPSDAKYDLIEEQRNLLAAMIEMLSQGKSVREKELGDAFANPGSRDYLMDESAYARQNRCPKCISRDKKPKVNFPSEDHAMRFANHIRDEKGVVQIVYRCPHDLGWHLKSSRPFRGSNGRRADFQDPMAELLKATVTSDLVRKLDASGALRAPKSEANDGKRSRIPEAPDQMLTRCTNCGWDIQSNRMSGQPCPLCGSKAHLTKLPK